MSTHVKIRWFLFKDTVFTIIFLILMVGAGAWMLPACVTSQPDSFETRLTAMSDQELVSYYRGLNDRIKDLQAGTKDADSQGVILQDDHVAKMPYIIGGEAWSLEQKAAKVRKELHRRNIQY